MTCVRFSLPKTIRIVDQVLPNVKRGASARVVGEMGRLVVCIIVVGDMSRAAKSLFVFGVYLCGLGLVLLLAPNLLLRVFGVPATDEVWIRVNGMFVLCLSFYYVQAARSGLTSFIRWTVWARAAVIIYFVAFVLLLSAPRALLLFGLVDLSAAAWTWLALKKDEARRGR